MLISLLLALSAVLATDSSAAVVRAAVVTRAVPTAVPALSVNAGRTSVLGASILAPAALSPTLSVPQAPSVAALELSAPAVPMLPGVTALAAPAAVPSPSVAPVSAAAAGPQAAPSAEAGQVPSLVDRLGQAAVAPDADIFDNSAPRRAVEPDSQGVTPGVKVCGVHEKASVLAALSAARSAKADNLIIGMLVGIKHFSREKVATKDAPALVDEIRTLSRSMAVPVKIAFVTHHVRARALIDMIGRISRRVMASPAPGAAPADIIQIHDAMPLPEIAKVKKAFPAAKIIKALSIPKVGEASDLEALLAQAVGIAAEPFIDGLLLDSADPSRDQIGGTGLTNDWDVARAVIDRVHERTGKPVALAGGLDPENASAAMERTHADMLDANSGFRLDRKGSVWDDPKRSAPKDAFAIFSVLRQMAGRVSPYFRRLIAG